MTSLQSFLKHWIVFIAIFLFRSDEEDLSKKEKPVFISNNVKCILLGILEPSLALTSGQGSLSHKTFYNQY